MLKSKGSVIQIRNTDEFCCARAIVTAIARIEKHPQWDNNVKGVMHRNSWHLTCTTKLEYLYVAVVLKK